MARVEDPARPPAGQSCGTCGASAVANCVALCCCPCAVVSCFTLALVKAPYMAGRRWVRRAKTRRISRGVLRKTRRVRSLDAQLYQVEGLGGGGTAAQASKEEDWGGLGRAAASGWWENTNDVNLLGDGRMRVSVTEKAWMEMYDVGLWGFGRLSFSLARDAAPSPAAQVVRDDPQPQEDGTVAPGR
ncbi:hypothetical protein TRIUR3_25065 [Triticum urartu]|uniref:Uncharacterized protein n=1 Tax=Triticum urartu TaxID=4572 RepID=M7ZL74_TRIUA|nr:hypothetical protein TRIUR3_25065 [Triticum urartu]